jgi:hypothetical protein
VISRADNNLRSDPEPLEVLEDHNDLRAQIHARVGIEQVARDDDYVIAGRRLQQPVELGQRVVDVGDDQDLHAAPLTLSA